MSLHELLDDLKFEFMLLRKFQTDILEFLFGKCLSVIMYL